MFYSQKLAKYIQLANLRVLASLRVYTNLFTFIIINLNRSWGEGDYRKHRKKLLFCFFHSILAVHGSNQLRNEIAALRRAPFFNFSSSLNVSRMEAIHHSFNHRRLRHCRTPSLKVMRQEGNPSRMEEIL